MWGAFHLRTHRAGSNQSDVAICMRTNMLRLTTPSIVDAASVVRLKARLFHDEPAILT